MGQNSAWIFLAENFNIFSSLVLTARSILWPLNELRGHEIQCSCKSIFIRDIFQEHFWRNSMLRFITSVITLPVLRDRINLEETLDINMELFPMFIIVLYLTLVFCSCDFFRNDAFTIILKENVSHKKI